MTISEIALVCSTLLGPVVAVQVTQWVDRMRQRRADRYGVFRTLMVTRAAALDPRHIEALNLIDLAFTRLHRDREVREAWKRYLAHLNAFNTYPQPNWLVRRVELLNELLYALARNLGFDIDRSVIESAVYFPQGAGTKDQDLEKIRTSLAKMLGGRESVPVQIVAQTEMAQPAHGQHQQPPAPAAAAGDGAAAA